MPTPLTKEEFQLVVDGFTQKALIEIYAHKNTLTPEEAEHFGAEMTSFTAEEMNDVWADVFEQRKE